MLDALSDTRREKGQRVGANRSASAHTRSRTRSEISSLIDLQLTSSRFRTSLDLAGSESARPSSATLFPSLVNHPSTAMACILPSFRSGSFRERARSVATSAGFPSTIRLFPSHSPASRDVFDNAQSFSTTAGPSLAAPAIAPGFMTPLGEMTSRYAPTRSAQRDNSPTHTLNIKSSRNNIHITYTSHTKGGKTFATITGGTDRDFKKANRSSYEAAHQAALKAFAKIQETGSREDKITVAFNGLQGQGREAVAAALAGSDGDQLRSRIVKVEDRTPIRIGGTRAKKPRRL